MLEHSVPLEQNTSYQTPPVNADTMRVTAEEFSAAVTALEQRKSAEAALLAGTVEIGATVRELGIKASPEDIYHEILAERARRNPPPDPQILQQQQEARQKVIQERELASTEAKAHLIAAANDAAKGVAAVATLVRSHLEEVAESRNRPGSRAARKFANQGSLAHDVRQMFQVFGWGIVGSAIGLFWLMAFSHHGAKIAGDIVQPVVSIVQTETPQIASAPSDMTLSNVASGQTVFAANSELGTILANGGTLSGTNGTIGVSAQSFDNSWPLLIDRKKIYLEGFVKLGSPDITSGKPVTVYPDRDAGGIAGNSAEAVTIPLKGVVLESRSAADQSVTLKESPVQSPDK